MLLTLRHVALAHASSVGTCPGWSQHQPSDGTETSALSPAWAGVTPWPHPWSSEPCPPSRTWVHAGTVFAQGAWSGGGCSPSALPGAHPAGGPARDLGGPGRGNQSNPPSMCWGQRTPSPGRGGATSHPLIHVTGTEGCTHGGWSQSRSLTAWGSPVGAHWFQRQVGAAPGGSPGCWGAGGSRLGSRSHSRGVTEMPARRFWGLAAPGAARDRTRRCSSTPRPPHPAHPAAS